MDVIEETIGFLALDTFDETRCLSKLKQPLLISLVNFSRQQGRDEWRKGGLTTLGNGRSGVARGAPCCPGYFFQIEVSNFGVPSSHSTAHAPHPCRWVCLFRQRRIDETATRVRRILFVQPETAARQASQ